MLEKTILQKFEVSWEYPVCFTQNVFDAENTVFLEAVSRREPQKRHRLLFVVDESVAKAHSTLENQIAQYVSRYSTSLELAAPILMFPGGEEAKNKPPFVENIQKQIHDLGLCRQSFLVAIGGGAVLDMAGYACSTPHRGLRLVRIPTTVLSQNDSGVGVKNAINAFGKKNFLGTFSPPFGIINDSNFLTTLSFRDWISGVAEAVKVALLKAPDFFLYLQEKVALILDRDISTMQEVVYRCAELHLKHIRTSGDPFEYGSSRPLDFGHWAAHKLESLSNYRLRHGEAVASGIALDTCYSVEKGFLAEKEGRKILCLLKKLGFSLYQEEMEDKDFLHGLTEFREHLGGVLCIPLLKAIGSPVEVQEMDASQVQKAIFCLKRKSL